VKVFFVTNRLFFSQKVKKIEGVLFIETTLKPKDNETVCFIGSIIDKSEFYYRQLMNVNTKYITLVEDDIDRSKIANFWIKNSTIMSYQEFKKEFASSK
jgi:hypothetical protein